MITSLRRNARGFVGLLIPTTVILFSSAFAFNESQTCNTCQSPQCALAAPAGGPCKNEACCCCSTPTGWACSCKSFTECTTANGCYEGTS
jgi:hypothetical protein